jgi:hypothetical protein
MRLPLFEKLSQLWRRLLFYARRERFDRELEEEMRVSLRFRVWASRNVMTVLISSSQSMASDLHAAALASGQE